LALPLTSLFSLAPPPATPSLATLPLPDALPILALRQAAATVPGPERDKLFEQSTADAELILTRYPGSRLKLEAFEVLAAGAWEQDRKSTRLNSSHVKISYAVFCLKNKVLYSSGP